MEQNRSYMREYLLTCLTCGLAVVLLGALLYVGYTYPQESEDFLATAWVYLSTELSFVGTAANFIWFVVTYPFVFVFQAILGATALFWIPLFCAYLWCSCISYHLKKKGIESKVYKAFNSAANYFGAWFVFCVYVVCLARPNTFMDRFASFFGFTLILFIKFVFVSKLEDEWGERREALKPDGEADAEAQPAEKDA